ncbi:MAG TPA: hypothetical protein VFK38_00915 [Candidatus Limnocylindrales bacterium]|nr:hypothetical protein [Candidatus Limnocylindrales bacterium]
MTGEPTPPAATPDDNRPPTAPPTAADAPPGDAPPAPTGAPARPRTRWLAPPLFEAGTPPKLRPLGVGDICDQAMALFLRHWVLFLAIVLPFVAISTAVTLALARPMTERFPYLLLLAREQPQVTPGLIELAALYLGASTIIGLTFLLASAATLDAAMHVVLGREQSAPSALLALLRRLPALVLASLVAFLLVAAWIALIAAGLVGLAASSAGEARPSPLVIIGLLSLVIAVFVLGIYVSMRLALYLVPLMLERRGPIACYTRSWQLTAGRVWRTLGLLVVLGLLGSLPATAAQAVGGLFAGTPQSVGTIGPYIVVQFVVTGIAGLLSVPITAIGLALVYLDFRARRGEAFEDVAVVGMAPSAPAQPPGEADEVRDS